MTEKDAQNTEEPENPNVVKGKFVERFRDKFGPNATYEIGRPTVYIISSGIMYLNGKPIRKVR